MKIIWLVSSLCLGRFEGWIRFYKTYWIYCLSPYLSVTSNVWREKNHFNFQSPKCNFISGLIQQRRNNFDICSFNIWFNIRVEVFVGNLCLCINKFMLNSLKGWRLLLQLRKKQTFRTELKLWINKIGSLYSYD